MSTILENMWSLVPAHQNDAARIERLRECQQGLTIYNSGTAEQELHRQIERYSRGEKIDLMRAALNVEKVKAEGLARNTLISAIIDEIRQLKDSPEVINAADRRPAYEYLQNELQLIIEAVHELEAPLAGIPDAPTAIRRGMTSEWAAIDELVSRYADVREAQLQLTQTLNGVDNTEITIAFRRSGLLADALDRDAYWTDLRWSSSRISQPTSTEERAWVNWLRTQPQKNLFLSSDFGVFPTEDRIAYLRWIVRECEPWLPDAETMLEANRLAYGASSRTSDNGDTTHLETARAGYYAVTGATPGYTVATEPAPKHETTEDEPTLSQYAKDRYETKKAFSQSLG